METLLSYSLPFILFLVLVDAGAALFEVQPSDTEVIEGGLAILRCTVTESDDANLYWRFIDEYRSLVPLAQNRDIQKYAKIHGDLSRRLSIGGDPNHGEYNLLISNITMEDQRQYVCTIIQDQIAYDSRKATILVRPSHPLLPDKLDPLPVCLAEVINYPTVFRIGAMVRFTCASPAGFPVRELRWTRVGEQRATLVTCPNTPCVHNRILTIDDVNAVFVCEMTEGSTTGNEFECTSTPLAIKTGVFVDPPVSERPAGTREGFICLPVNYDPNQLLFQWYLQSRVVSNGTNMSTLNILISRYHAESKLSCVVSSLDGTFRGIGHATIDAFDPFQEYVESEGSSVPVITNEALHPVTPRSDDTGVVQGLKNGTGGSILHPSSTILPTSRLGLSIQPNAELNNNDEKSQHLSVLVAVSAISGALITLLVCIIGLGALLFLRRRGRKGIAVQQDRYVYETNQNTCVGLEMNAVNLDRKRSDQGNCGYSEITEKRVSLQQSFVSDLQEGSDRFYATLESDSEVEYADGVISRKGGNEEQSDSSKPPGYAPPCTPSDYARPQVKAVDFSDHLNKGVINEGFSKSHERKISDCSASAYAVTDIVSEEARFVFKGMTERQQSADRPATMSRALVRNQSAPPLPARTLPRTFSTSGEQTKEEEPFGQRRQSDTDAIKDKANSASKGGIGYRWSWLGKNTKGSSRTLPVEQPTAEPPPADDRGRDHRSLSLGIGSSGEYAEIVSVDSPNGTRSSGVNDRGDFSPIKRHSMTGERLDSIPERSATAPDCQDTETCKSSKTSKGSSSSKETDGNPDPGYDRLARPKLVLSSPPKRSLTNPIYAKVKKSKSLDQDTSQKTPGENGDSLSSPIAEEEASTSPMLQRSISEGASPSVGGKRVRNGGYEAVEKSEKLDSILTQIRNGFAGKTLDIPENEDRDESQTKINKGGHFAEIV